MHGCDGLNSCKGQGGCGEHPGQNQCKGQGACAVTLKDKTWQKARDKFEELMAARTKDGRTGPGERLIAMKSSARDLANIQAWMQSVIMNPLGVIDGIESADAREHIDVSRRTNRNGDRALVASDQRRAARNLCQRLLRSACWSACGPNIRSRLSYWVRRFLTSLAREYLQTLSISQLHAERFGP